MAYKINPFTTNFDYYESGSTIQDLDSVLTAGNNAGANDIDLNNNDLLNADKISFFTGTTDVGGVAQIKWDNADGTLEFGMKGGSVIQQIGLEQFARVVNKTSPLIDLLEADYQVVRISGAQGQRLAIRLAQANNDMNSATTLGVVTENILRNEEGFITTFGLVRGINTTGALQGETWADGDVLYLSPTVAGQLTNIKPIAPQHLVIVGYVEYAHNVNGKIFVKVDNGYELNELHDVAYPTTPVKGETLEYDGTRWVNVGIVYTIELIDNLSVDFYAPYDLKINSVSNVLAVPTVTILDDGAAYTLTNTILSGSKITVNVTVASVINLNISKA